MASFASTIVLLVSVFLHPSSALVTIKISEKLEDSICKQTLNYEFCKSTLDSNSRIRKAKMKEVGIITVLLATAQARENKYVVDDLLHEDTNPVTKQHLADCSSDYVVTLGKLMGAYRLFDAKDYKVMRKLVNDAFQMSAKCEDRFLRHNLPSPIGDYSLKMIWLIDIALVVLSILDG